VWKDVLLCPDRLDHSILMILNYCNAIIIWMVDKSTRTRMKDYQNIGTGDNNILCFMDAV
jgi:hypothetical protein